MKYFFIALSFLLILSACTESDLAECLDDTLEENGAILIRIENRSIDTFEDIFVDTNGGSHTFCNLKPGEKSEYRRFRTAFRYAYVELKSNGKTYTIQPIDYVGEAALDPGKYTYVLNTTDRDDQYSYIELNLVVD